MGNLFTPQSGFAQSVYHDQMATALPGQLVHASDNILVDSYIVDPSIGNDGLEAGFGFVASAIPANDREGFREGMNMVYASLPTDTTVPEDFAGITVRNQQMDTNAHGRACWFANRLCNGMRSNRVGGRIWVHLSIGSTAYDTPVNLVVADTTGHGKPIGTFSAVAIVNDTIELYGAKFKSNSDATANSTIAIVEMGLEV